MTLVRAIVISTLAASCGGYIGPLPTWPSRPPPYPNAPADEHTRFYRDHRAEHWDSGGAGSVRFGERGEWVTFEAAEYTLTQSVGARGEIECRNRGRTFWAIFLTGLGASAVGGGIAGLGYALDSSPTMVTGLVLLGLGGTAFFSSILGLPSDNRCRPQDAVEEFNRWLWREYLRVNYGGPPSLAPEAPPPVIPLGR